MKNFFRGVLRIQIWRFKFQDLVLFAIAAVCLPPLIARSMERAEIREKNAIREEEERRGQRRQEIDRVNAIIKQSLTTSDVDEICGSTKLIKKIDSYYGWEDMCCTRDKFSGVMHVKKNLKVFELIKKIKSGDGDLNCITKIRKCLDNLKKTYADYDVQYYELDDLARNGKKSVYFGGGINFDWRE